MGPEHARCKQERDLARKKLEIALQFIESLLKVASGDKGNAVVVTASGMEHVLSEIGKCTI